MQSESYYYSNPTADKDTIGNLQRQLEEKMLTYDVSSDARKHILRAIADERNWSDSPHAPEEKLFAFKEATLRDGLRKVFSFVPSVSYQTDNGRATSLTCESFETDQAAIKKSLIDYLTHRLEQAKAVGSDAASKWRKAILLAEKLISTPKLYDKVLELADEATLELEADIALGGTVNLAQSIEQIKSSLPKKRKKGGRHPLGRNKGAWKTQAEVARDMDKARFTPEHGEKAMGAGTIDRVKQMDQKHPDPANANKFGYHAQLRLDERLKEDYKAFLARWYAHWDSYKEQFKEWRKNHPASKRSSFRFKEPQMTTNFNVERVAYDKHGEIQPIARRTP